MKINKFVTSIFEAFGVQEKYIQMSIQRQIKKNSQKITFCKDLITRYSWYHGITFSLRTLKRLLADHRLNKIGSDISDASLQVIIEREVNGPSSLKGYRNIWNKLRVTYGIKVPRDKVMEILRNIDPVNSALRKARKLSAVLRFDEVCL